MEQQPDFLRDLEIYIGKRLREKRQKLNLTLAYVAEKLGVSHQQIQKYEQAQSRVSAGTLYQLAQIYGVSSTYFFEGFNLYRKIDEHGTTDVIFHNINKTLNILLVEDDPADELLTRRALDVTEHKTNVFCVHDGIQAIEFLRYKKISIDFPRPDIVLLDLNIPKRDGLNVLKEIKRDRELQDLPVIILTNCISKQELVAVYKNGASAYVAKAFEFNVFQKNINTLVNYWSEVAILPGSSSDENYLESAAVAV